MANCGCVVNWLRAYREKGEDGLQSKPKGRKPKNAKKTMEELEAENEALRRENELASPSR
jgi:transposase